MPPEFETRRGYSQGSKLVSWSQFLVLNRGWITTIEVTRLQAEGNEAFGNSITSLLERTKMMVVATFSQCPTSVLPPKEPPEITSTTTRP